MSDNGLAILGCNQVTYILCISVLTLAPFFFTLIKLNTRNTQICAVITTRDNQKWKRVIQFNSSSLSSSLSLLLLLSLSQPFCHCHCQFQPFQAISSNFQQFPAIVSHCQLFPAYFSNFQPNPAIYCNMWPIYYFFNCIFKFLLALIQTTRQN